MPQTSPMNWTLLLITYMTILLNMIMMKKKTIFFKSKKKTMKNKLFLWKW